MGTKGIKNKKIELTEAKTVLDNVKKIKIPDVLSEISSLQTTIQKNLAEISISLSNKLQEVENLDTAILLKENRLAELHGIEKEAITLDEMKAQKEEEEKNFALFKQDKEKSWQEQETEREKLWSRQNEERDYNFKLQHKKWTDEFAAEVANSKRAEHKRQEDLNRSWAERETSLKTKEQEVVDLRKQVNEFDNKLKVEVAKAEAVVGHSLKNKFEHEIALIKKDYEAEKNMNLLKTASQEKIIVNLQDQVKELNVKLDLARADAKEVAQQALQSAAQRQVAEALQKVVGDSRDQNHARKA